MDIDWKWPIASRKAHLFEIGESRSLCGKWMYVGTSLGVFHPDSPDGLDDCKACTKKARKLQGAVK